MRKKHRILWIILSVMVLVSMVMFSVLPYLSAAELPTPQEGDRTVPPYSTQATSDTTPILGPGAASVTATVPETEFNRPKQVTYWIAAFKNLDPYVSLLVGSIILVVILFLVAFIFWKKTKKSQEKETAPRPSMSSKDKALKDFLSEKSTKQR